MLADELLPCPGAWCKHKAEPRLVSGGGGLHSVICGDCRTQGPISSDKDFAIAAWNTRPEASQGEVELRAAKAAIEAALRAAAGTDAFQAILALDIEAILKGERKPE